MSQRRTFQTLALSVAAATGIAGVTAVIPAPMKATLLGTPTMTYPSVPPALCGQFKDDTSPNYQCGGACGFGQICQAGQPFGSNPCFCGPDPALPTTPPLECGQYAPDGAEFPLCGGACGFGQVCKPGQPFGGAACICGADPALPTTPPASCGQYAPAGAESFQCGGACPAGETCTKGQPFGQPCSCSASAAPAGGASSFPRL